MKIWKTGICITVLILLFGLYFCACSRLNGQNLTETTEPATLTTEAASEEVVFSEVSLELRPYGRCKLYEIEGLPYFEAGELSALCEGKLTTKLHGDRLRLGLEMLDREVSFLEGSRTAKSSDGEEIGLEADLVPTTDGLWFLPLNTLNTIWGRELVTDQEENQIRCLALTPCEESVLVNGTQISNCLSCEDCLLLPLAQSVELLGGSVDENREGQVGRLTVRTPEHEWILEEGASTAQADGSALWLPIPALKREERWYVPAASAAAALGGSLITDPSQSRTDLLFAAESKYLWFAGKGMGYCQRIGDTEYAKLSALAKQLGAEPEQEGNTVTIDALGHKLTYSGGSVEVLVDGEASELKIPVIRTEQDWLIPIRQFAKALGIPKKKSEANELVFSRMKAGETTLWIEGKETKSYQLQEGAPYVNLAKLAEQTDGSFEIEENQASLYLWGKKITMTGGSKKLGIDGSTIKLSAPAEADGAAWYVPANDFLEAMGLSILEDPDIDQVFYTRIVKNDEIAKGYRVPVLMYHAVSDYMWGIPELFISPSTLEQQLQALVEGGYTAITFEDLDHIAEIEKPVMLTFDDGYNDNYTELFPLLKKYNVKATVFVIVNDMERVHNLTKEQVREMSDSGLVSIQSHTMSHGYLSGMSAQQLEYEHYQSMLALARITGKQPFVLCYPSGKNTYFSRSYTAKYYQYGLCMSGPCYETGTDPYYICRYYIPRNTTISKFLEYIG